jgi:hypothetical protein
MTSTTTTPVTDALCAALWKLAGDWKDGDHYAKAAAVGLVLAWIENGELAFHPHDPGHISDDYGAPQELVALMEACPDLEQAWRQWMAAKQLARWIATGMEKDSAKATNGLVAIASGSAIGEKESHHDHAGLVDAHLLEGLALIAIGEGC